MHIGLCTERKKKRKIKEEFVDLFGNYFRK